jgi:hypothetical protein
VGQIFVEASQSVPHRDRGTYGLKSIVLMHAREPENRHHSVADELLDNPAMSFEDRAHHPEVVVHDFPQGLGIEFLPEGGGADEIAEDDGNDLARVVFENCDGTKSRSALRTELRPRHGPLSALTTGQHSSSITSQASRGLSVAAGRETSHGTEALDVCGKDLQRLGHPRCNVTG